MTPITSTWNGDSCDFDNLYGNFTAPKSLGTCIGDGGSSALPELGTGEGDMFFSYRYVSAVFCGCQWMPRGLHFQASRLFLDDFHARWAALEGAQCRRMSHEVLESLALMSASICLPCQTLRLKSPCTCRHEYILDARLCYEW